MSIKTQENDLVAEVVEQLYNKLSEDLDTDIFFTGDNLQTLTWSCGTINGVERFGSIKFTLHKSNYNIDNEIEKYYDKCDEVELKKKLEAQREEEKKREIQRKKEKAERKAKNDALKEKKKQEVLKQIREELQND